MVILPFLERKGNARTRNQRSPVRTPRWYPPHMSAGTEGAAGAIRADGPSTREGLVERPLQSWARKLTDFSRRNNLLYFKAYKNTTLDLLGSEPAAFEAMLSGTDRVSSQALFPQMEDLQTINRQHRRRRAARRRVGGRVPRSSALSRRSWRAAGPTRRALHGAVAGGFPGRRGAPGWQADGDTEAVTTLTAEKAEFRLAVNRWADRIGVQPKGVFLQRMSTKWASCSATGRVSFSLALLRQPAAFQEVVIVHELLHLRVPNHGRLFQALLSAHLPNWRAATATGASTLFKKQMPGVCLRAGLHMQ